MLRHRLGASATWYTYTERGVPSMPVPRTHVPAHVRPRMRSPSVAGSGSVAATTSRGATGTPRTVTGSRRVEAGLVQHPEHLDELVAEPVLERDASAVDPAGDEQHFLVLDVHALDRADVAGKSKVSGSENGAVVNQPRSASQITRRVEALLDRRPDRERRREVEALDDEVRAVAHTDLVDL